MEKLAPHLDGLDGLVGDPVEAVLIELDDRVASRWRGERLRP